MVKILEGQLIGKGKRFGIVVSRFNDFITEKLLGGALDGLLRTGVKESDIHVIKVPGAFEIPLAAKKVVQGGNYDAVICLGAVIRGSTPHFDYVCSGAATGIQQVSLDTNKPIAFGVLTTDTMEQALQRSSTTNIDENKGRDAALCVLEMINVLKAVY